MCQPTEYCVNLTLPELWEVDPAFCYDGIVMYGYNTEGVWTALTSGATTQDSVITNNGA